MIKSALALLGLLEKNPNKKTFQIAYEKYACDLNKTLLCALDKKSSFGIVRILIESGAKINYKDSNNDTPLNHALRVSSSAEVIKYLLECGSDPKRKNFTGKSSLYLSLEYGNPVSVLSLLFSKENANVRLRLGLTPLHCSAKCGSSPEVINFLLKLGSDPKLLTENGSLPLHLAVQYNAPLETIAVLVKAYKKGINMRAKYQRTTLHLACQSESDHCVVEKLLQMGAKARAKDRFGRTPFQLLMKNKPKLRTVKLLIEAGAHFTGLDPDHSTCLHLLSTKKNANLKVLKYLLKFEIDLNIKNCFGFTCLHLAIMEKLDLDYIRLLIAHGADITIATPKNHHCFSLAVISRNSTETLKFFLKIRKFFLKMKKKEKKKMKKLMKMINSEKKHKKDSSKKMKQKKFQKIKKFVIKQKNFIKDKYRVQKKIQRKSIDFNLLDKNGYNSLHLVCKYRTHPKVIKLLMQKTVNINQLCAQGYSPLLLTVLNQERLDIIKLMVENGANIHQLDPKGNNCLHLSCKKHNIEIIKYFLDQGLDPNSRNVNFSTPLQISITSNNSLSIIKLLLKWGGDLNLIDKFSHNCLQLSILSRVGSETIHYLLHTEGVDLNIKNKNDRSVLDLAIKGKFDTSILIGMIESGIPINDDFVKQNVPSDSDILKIVKSTNSLCLDMLNLFERAEKTDLVINGIKVHKLIIELRLETNHATVKKILEQNYNYKQTKLFFKWVYAGQINENFKLINQIGKEFPSINIKSKSLRKGIANDLRRLYHQKKNKDFSLIIREKQINVNRLILQARSETFRGMFINISDDYKCVHDYTGMSETSLEKIIEFICCDGFDINTVTQKNIDEINQYVDYYQLNEFSRIEWIFDNNLVNHF
ncbi:ankyrin repeat ph and sec7 domain containing protein secg-related [Anaeramoeba flamelloides]|uniref:Ankyrin repeat ph and sec7 domain containing protein secg-related n=1 Tax=Anaeramoeba flamelloides TaxID=1746091 RepID=A0AAV7ZET5_9EUKA|nr:ankyrin repeat ph and sec7 domain containing protein secg-related [Anaeramoeba flamelloides]